eukprot:EG_transcript_25049
MADRVPYAHTVWNLDVANDESWGGMMGLVSRRVLISFAPALVWGCPGTQSSVLFRSESAKNCILGPCQMNTFWLCALFQAIIQWRSKNLEFLFSRIVFTPGTPRNISEGSP